MTTEELFDYITKEVPNFINPEIIGPGVAYHYTSHADKIISTNQFLGAPINKDLDRTQQSLQSIPATNSPGVVFAYKDFKDAKEEGFGCSIFKIEFISAIRAMHGQESELSSSTSDLIKSMGLDINLELNEHPNTLIILNTEIEKIELINKT